LLRRRRATVEPPGRLVTIQLDVSTDAIKVMGTALTHLDFNAGWAKAIVAVSRTLGR